MEGSPRASGGSRHRYRHTLLLMLIAVISGLFAPLAPLPPVSAQPRAASAPSAALAGRSPAPSAASAPAATTAQQANLVNVALGKQATQSNENALVKNPYPNGAPSNAVDGRTDGWYPNGSVTHTWGAVNDWWQVDLGGRYPVERIDLWNRTDCCPERLNNFYVFVSDVPFASDSLSAIQEQAGVGAYFTTGVAGTTTSITVGRSARYVRVVLSQPGLVALAEVQVWSSRANPLDIPNDAINVAQGKTASQHSTYSTGVAGLALDGNTNGNYLGNSVSHSLYSASGVWWQVDLGGSYPIDQIDVWNRTDCCAERLNNFYILVSDTPFTLTDTLQLSRQNGVSAFYTGGVAGLRTSTAINRTGRYVRVALEGAGLLSLAEVQVWSKQRTPVEQVLRLPQLTVGAGDGAINLFWFPVPGATSYRIERAATPGGPYTTLAASHTTTLPGTSILTFGDGGRTNEVFVYYRVIALDAAGQQVNYSEETKAKATVSTAFDAFQPIPAANYTGMAGLSSVQDSVLNRPVMTGFESGDTLAFANVNFSSAPNGVSLSYSLSKPVAGSFQLVALPAGVVLATVPVTGTGGTWSSANALSSPVTGVQSVYMAFTGQGGENLRIDQLQFSKPGPFDTATVKWDPNIVLLHKSMGIALDSFLLDESDMTLLMRFSTTTTQGRGQFALLKPGSIIASDTNIDLGGPYARVKQVVSLNDSQVAVKTEFVGFNQLIYAGGIDLTDAINQSFNSTTQGLVGTSAVGPGYNPAGYDTPLPTVIYEGGAPPQAGRSAGMGSVAAQTSDVPAITAPNEARGTRTGTFHVTADNFQFVGDEDGFGVEIVNLRLNALGIADNNDPNSNPVAKSFNFGVLGGVGFDTLRLQIKLKVANGFLSRDQNIDVGAQLSAKAHAQLKGLAVGMWFFEVPMKWLKPIRFMVPTPVGPVPSSLVFGVQGYIIGVGLGNLVAEIGTQVILRPTLDFRKVVEIKPFGETNLAIGQRVNNLSLLGFALEPYAKVRFGAFDLLLDNALSEQVLRWIAFGLRIPSNKDALKKLQGLVVFTFTPRMQLLNILQNWKDKDRPIFEQKACMQPVVKAEALPGFPKKMTFELRVELPVYLCLFHTGYLYYDMVAPDTVPANPQTREATIEWGVPIVSERSRIPHNLNWVNGIPYDREDNPVVESRFIADSYPVFQAGTRRFCVIYRRPFNLNDSAEIVWQGPCQEQAKTKVTVPAGLEFARYVLRVMTEYRPFDTPLPLVETINCDAQGLPCGNSGVWSEKIINVSMALDSTTFKVNNTEVFTTSARYQDPIQGKTCDPDGLRALDMELSAAIAPASNSVPAGRWEVESARMQIDGVDVASTTTNGARPGEKVLTLTGQNLAGGPHTIAIIAKLRLPNYDSFKREATYYATFRAQPKPCGEAKPDEHTGLIFEGSRCAKQDTNEQTLPVLDNDNLGGTGTMKITGVSAAKLGSVRINADGTALLYKPTSKGVDSFVYEVTITLSNGSTRAKANVMVTNRAPETDAECVGGGGGGGNTGGGNPDKSGSISNWGDPHITTADGLSFDSHALGEFVYLQPRAGQTGMTVHGRQELFDPRTFAAMTTALAFKIGTHVVQFRAGSGLAVRIDGQTTTARTIELGEGATLTIGSMDAWIITSSTTTHVINKGIYLDSQVSLPLDNRLEGMWGTPNDNKADDMRLPNGTPVTDTMVLADGWRITDRAKSLFTYATGEGPETYNKPNVYIGLMPTPEMLAPYVQQARDLLAGTCANTVAPDETVIKALALDLYLGTSANNLAAQLCSYELSGTITSTNPAGAPVVGALVSLTSQQTQPCSAYTDLQGRYRCRLAPLPGAAAPTVTVTVAGTTAQSYTFPAKAPNGRTLTQTLNLAVTRPSIVLTLRSLDAATNAPTPNTRLQVWSGDVQQQVTTGPDGTASLLLTYQPGTTSTGVSVTAVEPAYSTGVYQSVVLNPSAPVSLALDVKHVVLGTPVWSVEGSSSGGQSFKPQSYGSVPAFAADGTIYTIAQLSSSTSSDKPYRLMATSPSGALLWLSPFAFNNNQSSSPVIGPDGTIYVLTEQYTVSQLYAFNPTGGTLKWSFATPTSSNYVSPQPAMAADGTLYFLAGPSSGAPTLYAINPASGTAAWSYALPNGYGDSPVAVGPDGTIYVLGSVLRAFNPNGTLKGATTFSVRYNARMVIGADGAVFLVAGHKNEGPDPETIAINPNLTLRWSRPGVGAWDGAIIGQDGALYLPIGDYSGSGNGLLKLDPLTGATLWSAAVVPEVTPVLGADGVLYTLVRKPAVVDHNEVVGVRASDGVVTTRFKLRSVYPDGLAMGPNGLIILAVSDSTSTTDLWTVPTNATGGPAAGWTSIYGGSKNTSRRAP